MRLLMHLLRCLYDGNERDIKKERQRFGYRAVKKGLNMYIITDVFIEMHEMKRKIVNQY